MTERIAVLCPGRGSYGASELGSLDGLDSADQAGLRRAIDRIDEVRAAAGDLTIREMDGAEKFRSRFLRGENAAPLIFAVTALQTTLLSPDKARIVAVGGNSMGWYSALYCGGSLGLDDAFRLVETMGSMTRDGSIGGQVIYPVVGDDWRADPGRAAAVHEATALALDGRGRVGSSIRFGGFEVLWGNDEGVSALLETLPAVELGKQSYPLHLFGNSAFHSPLMRDGSLRGLAELASIGWRRPDIPLVDGRGTAWRTLSTDPAALCQYTLGHQVTETFDFAATVRTILREYAPDRIVALGPGESLGGAIAHVLIQERWQGIDSRDAFIARQEADPFVVSLARAEQAAFVM